MTATPKGYEKAEYINAYFRPLEPNAASVIEALSVLPPDTKVTVGSNEWDGGKTEPKGIGYYPDDQEAFIA